MTLTHTISSPANTDHLPRPFTAPEQDHSASGLPRPVASIPNVADSGRISFGAAMRLPSGR
jgi:hypothetical protein